MEAVDTSSAEKFIEASKSVESSPSRRISDGAASDASSSSPVVSSTPDPSDHPNSPLNPQKGVQIQSSAELRSEEYRQMFHLPPEEVLIRDFNCAFQESILLQGHMYVFVRYICFYSNIFGFETKKIIPFPEITCIRRAKTAGIFPNAIEIIAGGRKYFFASFLSRDEAFKLINDGWLQHRNDTKSVSEQQQESISESCGQENGIGIIENVKSFNHPSNESDAIDGNEDAPILDDPKLPPTVEDEIMSTRLPEGQDNVEEAQPVLVTDSSAVENCLTWKEENSDVPKIPEYYTRVAEAKFPIKVEQFFSIFFSDAAADFLESFHKRCGDKDFKCSSWYPHDKYGHARDVSFQHPIKLYLGAKFGSCQEIQKFRVYRNSHLVIETSQEVSDVPYGDYFCVEGLWDLEEDGDVSKESCVLRVYVNVAFSKRTVWKGKIVQSTVEECREAFANWIDSANELLKQKNLEKHWSDCQRDMGCPAAHTIQNNQVHLERQVEKEEPSKRSHESNDPVRIQQLSDSKKVEHKDENILQGSLVYTTPILTLFKEAMVNFCSFFRSRSHLPALIVTFAAILLLMQFSIVVLMTRPPQVHVISQADHISGMRTGLGEKSSEALGWLEKRMHHLKEEMLMVESRLEQMKLEHRLLKTQLEDLKHYKRKRI